jgi:hypothetical protein
MLGYFKGLRKNLRNGGGHCLDIWGGASSKRTASTKKAGDNDLNLTFWPCNIGLN